MKRDKIITGQNVTPEKREMAKELRRNMTPAERALWQRLRANRLNGRHFRRQQIIDGFIVDFYCHQAGLIIEVDGPIHDSQREADAEREAILQGRGLTILRYTNRQVMNHMNEVLREIKRVLDAVDPPPSPLPTWKGEHSPSKSEDRDPAISSAHLVERPSEQSPAKPAEGQMPISPPRFGEGPGEGS